MKKSILLSFLILMMSTVVAENVNQNRAMQVAINFAAQHDRSASQIQTEVVYSHPMPNKRDAAFYVVNLGETGFVIVAADDVAHPVLGYSFERPWTTEGNLPPQVTDYLDDLANQIESASETTSDRGIANEWQELLAINPNKPPQPRGNRTEVGPLLTTTWDQEPYYNALCPEDANTSTGHVVTGCVATAMAQIINYHEYPLHGRGTHSYDSNYGTLSIDFAGETYDYDNMPNALSSGSTPEQVNAVATLMRDCGVAVNMDYTSGESGAFDIDARAALINFFKFSPNLSFAEKAFFTEDEWHTMLRSDLDASHPVIYSGRSNSGGHTFVCDGYNSDGYFSFNFGWGGNSNGWYLTDAVLNYNSSQTALLGIMPDENGNVIIAQMSGTSTFIVDEPLEFYHVLGHNAYTGNNYSNPCNNVVSFISEDNENQLVADIIELKDQSISIYDGNTTNTLLRTLTGGDGDDMSPVVSSEEAMTLVYDGYLTYAGYKLMISPNSDCRMVSNLLSYTETTTIHLAWTENGNATQWQVEYGPKGFSHGDGIVITASENTTTIDNLTSFMEYDFYIRSVCGNNQYGLWNKITVFVEAPYWQDVVLSQPEGFMVNNVTNTVEISTAEGLAWWTKNGCEMDAYLTADIDLAQYKWLPVQSNNDLFGNGHVISNLYVNEITNNIGLFSSFYGVLDNVGLYNAYVSGSGYYVGGFCGSLYGQVINCYIINSAIYGEDQLGGIAGFNGGEIINCYANDYVCGLGWRGNLVGANGGTIRNCYATGSVNTSEFIASAGIVGISSSGEITNCYAETSLGIVVYTGTTTIADTSTFVKNDLGCVLNTPIVIEGESETDLLSVLNRVVAQYNDNQLCTWMADDNNFNGGYPVLSDKYVVNCPNVSDFSVQNVIINNSNAVVVSWTENGSSVLWEIRYRPRDLPNSEYTIIDTEMNPDTIYGIPLGFVYDFNVRAIVDAEHMSGWSNTQSLLVDLPYWTDIIKEQPAGYVEDSNGNVEISSVEGLVWLSVVVNGLHNQQPNSFEGKTVTLMTDIDLDGYRWYPIGRNLQFNTPPYVSTTPFKGLFDGQGETISNLYINDDVSQLGLFGYVCNATIQNVVINGNVASPNSSPTLGGLVGYAYNCNKIDNCHSYVNVRGYKNVGSLCGDVTNHNGRMVVENCSAMGSVTGREACGGLVGRVYGDVVIRNCYATGDIDLAEGGSYPLYRGGLVGYLAYASAYNCYAVGNVYFDQLPNLSIMIFGKTVGKVIGCPEYEPHLRYLYALDTVNTGMMLAGYMCEDISDTAMFHHGECVNSLLTPVSINEVWYSDMLEAMNAWVTLQNDESLRTWSSDDPTGYPVFGDYYATSCNNPTDLIVTNATIIGDATIRTEFSWTQDGDPISWEVLYVDSEQDLESGVIVSVTTNPCVLTDLPIGRPLDFYVRAVCNNDNVSNWSSPITYIPDKLHWTEVVISNPIGYTEDLEGNAYISTAEGLAWFASVVMGLNGMQSKNFQGKNVFITADIDLSEYRWNPIGSTWRNSLMGCNVYGNYHTISGLYCNELDNKIGLFGYTDTETTISNLRLVDCEVYGKEYVGGIVGYALSTDIINCTVEGTVLGIETVGGIVGEHSGISNCICNTFFRGIVNFRQDITSMALGGYVGGICGTPFESVVNNCYVVSSIVNNDFFDDWAMGIITGTGGFPDTVSNCYYLSYQTNLPITSDNCIAVNNSSFSSSGNTWTLNTPPYISGVFYTDLLDALNAWVDANNTDDQYLHWVADTANVNGGFPMLEQPPIANHWTTPQGYEGNMTFAGVVIVDGEEVALDYIELGAFVGDECRGSALPVKMGERRVYFLLVAGNAEDEGTALDFKLYDHLLHRELDYYCTNNQSYHEDLALGVDELYGFNFLTEVEQTAQMSDGWTWWSTGVELSYIDGLSMLEEALGDTGVIIKTSNQFVQNMDLGNGWMGSLAALTNERCYKIQTSAECAVTMRGPAARLADHPIEIQPEWNWIGYPVAQAQNVTSALDGFQPSANDIIKGQNGYATYIPNLGWLPEFTLEPAKGYLYHSNNSANQTLVYSVNRGDIPKEEADTRFWHGNVHGYADNLCLLAVVSVDGEEQRTENLELGAFVEDECRGSARLLYVEPFDRYFAVMTVSGEDGDEVYFKLMDRSDQSVRRSGSSPVVFANNAVVGAFGDPFEIAFAGHASSEENDASLVLYPNPVGRGEPFRLLVPGDETVVEWTVFDALGTVVRHKTSAFDSHTVERLPVSGVYLVKVVCRSGNTYHHRLIVK